MNVVVLDGEPLVRQELRRTLQSANPEWSVLEAGNVRDATDLLIRESITVLLADDVDLIGCARALSPETISILLADPSDAIPPNGVRVLAKPFEAERLLGEVAEAISEHETNVRLHSTLRRILESQSV